MNLIWFMNPAEAHILSKPGPFRGILLHVKAVIETVVPGADMKYKWRMPCFYLGKAPLCYVHTSEKKDMWTWPFGPRPI